MYDAIDSFLDRDIWKSGNAKVSLMVNLFLASGFKNSATTFHA